MDSVPKMYPRGRKAADPDAARAAMADQLKVHGEMEEYVDQAFFHLVAGARASGLSWEEIGGHLRQPVTTVRSRYIKAAEQ